MRLVQHLTDSGSRAVSRVIDERTLAPLEAVDSVYALAHRAAAEGTTVAALAEEFTRDERNDYQAVVDAGHLLPPIDHPVDPAHCLVSGTGLTYAGTGDARAALEARIAGGVDASTDPALSLLADGLAGGRPASGETGAQPEWFYKGDGAALLASGMPLIQPAFARGTGVEAEIAAMYVIDGLGRPSRIGYALANECTDHAMESANVLWLGHAKLRPCALGPELLLGDLPAVAEGEARVVRDGNVRWQQNFVAGEEALIHSVANLEQHLFRYPAFRRPGDVHVYCLGAAARSEGLEIAPGDVMEVSSPTFGRPLRSTLAEAAPDPFTIRTL